MRAFVGNDLIDLADTPGRHPRFPERAFGRTEAARWRAAGADPRALWLAWSAKEAVVKLLRQEAGAPTPFLPSQLEWRADERVVVWRGREIAVEHRESPEWILASCASGPLERVTLHHEVGRWTDYLRGTIADAPGALSLAVRELAREVLLRLRPELVSVAIDFRSGAGGEPVAWLAGAPSRDALSFSHDGAFVGVSVALSL
jgi:phosphopantetheinyl transferase (holo-ACP synthase)